MKLTEALANLYRAFQANGIEGAKIEITLPKRAYETLQINIFNSLQFSFSHEGKQGEMMYHGIKIIRAIDD